MQADGVNIMQRPDLAGGGTSGEILCRIFEALDGAGVSYCVLHGYECYPQRIPSDVDCLVSDRMSPRRLAAFFHRRKAPIGADLILWKGNSYLLAGRDANGSPCFLWIEFGADYDVGAIKFYRGSEILGSRQKYRGFWVPAAHMEFGCYLVRKVGKVQLDEEQGRRLSALYAQDPVRSERQVARFWAPRSVALLTAAARSGDWRAVRRRLPSLRAELRRRAMLKRPWGAAWGRIESIASRVKLLYSPTGGLTVAFLGPDGAGKSSVIAATARALDGAFNRSVCYGFAPGVLQWLRRPDGPNQQPHSAPPRSTMASVIRAVCYWLAYYLVFYRLTLRLQLAHSRLVLHDRHLVDALVDPRRYRYAGPAWLLRAIWRVVPKPDLIVLLEAPPEVLQARKQEVPFEESARQCQAYRSLVAGMPNGHIIDAGRPLSLVVNEVNDLILCCLASRTARRLAPASRFGGGKFLRFVSGLRSFRISARR